MSKPWISATDPVPPTMNSEPFPANYIELRTVSAEMSVNCQPCILLSMQRSAEFYVLRLAPHLNDHDVMPACSEHAEQAVQAYIRGLRR